MKWKASYTVTMQIQTSLANRNQNSTTMYVLSSIQSSRILNGFHASICIPHIRQCVKLVLQMLSVVVARQSVYTLVSYRT